MAPAQPVQPSPPSLDAHLAALRATYHRLGPVEVSAAAHQGALLVDIRYGALRDRDGTIPGAVIVERNELEWRLDPAGTHRLPEAVSYDLPVVVVCNEGYASTLAAASLHTLGLSRATDLAGGFQAWRAAGLPVTPPDGTPTRPAPSVAAADGHG
jgi:rhodanese-related sulfurtransferase